MTNALVPVGDLEKMARAMAASKLFGMTTPEQALALMLVAQAEGLHPATAARDYHIVQGRPALKADAMLARYLNSGGKVEWGEHTDARVSATFSHPSGGTLKIEWDMERAKKAGLGGKDMWSKYPRQMLRARVISEGIRATNPAVATGIYTPEEVQDMEPKEKNMGAAEVVERDWAKELRVAKTTDELRIAWTNIPEDRKPAFADLKDLLKMQFAAKPQAAEGELPSSSPSSSSAGLGAGAKQ